MYWYATVAACLGGLGGFGSFGGLGCFGGFGCFGCGGGFGCSTQPCLTLRERDTYSEGAGLAAEPRQRRARLARSRARARAPPVLAVDGRVPVVLDRISRAAGQHSRNLGPAVASFVVLH